MGRGTTVVFNLISIIFLALSVVWIVYVISRLAGPPPEVTEAASLPTAVVLPSLTPSNTPTETLIPTWTPTPTDTLTPTLTPTLTSTAPPTATITDTPGPTATVTLTFTPAATDTPFPTPTPEGPTPTLEPTLSPFPFDLRNNEVLFIAAFNGAGCAWQGMGGQVLDLNGQGLSGLRIHVFGPEVDRYVDSGSNSLYGPGGWEQPVSNAINGNTYFIELETAQGTVVSPRIQVTFPSDCTGNLALINFIQTRPL